MINLIERLIPENAAVMLDTGALRPRSFSPAFMNHELTREKIDINAAYEQGVQRLAEIEYLINNRDVLVINEVYREMRSFLSLLEFGRRKCNNFERHKKVLISNYLDQAKSIVNEFLDRDPRKKAPNRISAPYVEINSEIYSRLQKRIDEQSFQLEKNKRELHRDKIIKSAKKTDPHLIFTGYILNKEHDIPVFILHDDCDLVKLAKSLEKGAEQTIISGYDNARLVYSPSGYSMTLINLNATELDLRRN